MILTKRNIVDLRSYAKACSQATQTMISMEAQEVYDLADFALKAYEAMLGIEKKINDGVLVRDISNDHDPEWAVSASHLVLALKNLKDAIDMMEGVGGDHR